MNSSASLQVHVARLVFVLAVSTSAMVGCALPEHIDEAKCRIPPNYPHEFAAPVSYGHYPTRWAVWPGAESGPGYSTPHRRAEPNGVGPEEAETLPPPESNEPPPIEQENPFGPPNSGAAPDFGRAFDEPSPMPPTEDTQPSAPPLIEPRTPGATTPPSSTPPSEGEPLPESLFDEPATTPADITPDGAAWDINTLPSDEPAGSLIPEEQEIARRGVPGLLLPEKEMGRGQRQATPPIENAQRPSPNRGASGTGRRRSTNARAAQNYKPMVASGTASEEGPQLFAPEGTADGARATDTATVTQAANEQWISLEPPTSQGAIEDASSAGAAEESAAATAWHANPVRTGSSERVAKQSPSSNTAAGWQSRTGRATYPTMQTAHSEPAPAKRESSAPRSKPAAGGNPLR